MTKDEAVRELLMLRQRIEAFPWVGSKAAALRKVDGYISHLKMFKGQEKMGEKFVREANRAISDLAALCEEQADK